MKIYFYNEKRKWYKKIKWLKIFSFFLLFSFFLFFLFYIVIGNYDYLLRALWTSFIISFLISFGIVLSNYLKVKEVIFIERKNKLYICFLHNFDYSLLSYSELKKAILNSEDFINDFMNNPSLFIGIDVIEVEKINAYKVINDKFEINILGIYSYWCEKGGIFTSFNYEFRNNKKINKDFSLSIEYNNFSELLKVIKKY